MDTTQRAELLLGGLCFRKNSFPNWVWKAIPLSHLSAARVTNRYDVMDAAYCGRTAGSLPVIDHNPRGGEKLEFNPAEAVRYNERTVAERQISHKIA